MPTNKPKPNLIFSRTLLRREPPPQLRYLSDRGSALGRLVPHAAGEHRELYACGFVLVCDSTIEVPAFAFGVIAEDKNSAVDLLAKEWADAIGQFPKVLEANPRAVLEAKKDIMSTNPTQRFLESARPFQDRLLALMESDDEAFQFIMNEVGCFLTEILFLAGEESFDPLKMAIVMQTVGAYMRANEEDWNLHLAGPAAASLKEIRATVSLSAVSEDPERAN